MLYGERWLVEAWEGEVSLALGGGGGGGKEKEEDSGWGGQNLALGLRRGEKGVLCAPKRRRSQQQGR